MFNGTNETGRTNYSVYYRSISYLEKKLHFESGKTVSPICVYYNLEEDTVPHLTECGAAHSRQRCDYFGSQPNRWTNTSRRFLAVRAGSRQFVLIKVIEALVGRKPPTRQLIAKNHCKLSLIRNGINSHKNSGSGRITTKVEWFVARETSHPRKTSVWNRQRLLHLLASFHKFGKILHYLKSPASASWYDTTPLLVIYIPSNQNSSKSRQGDFYRVTLCVSAVFTVARCSSVCLSVHLSRWCIVLKISSNFFLRQVSTSV